MEYTNLNTSEYKNLNREGIPLVNHLTVEIASKKILGYLAMNPNLRGTSYEKGVTLSEIREEVLGNKKEDLESILIMSNAINDLISKDFISFTYNSGSPEESEYSLTIYPEGRKEFIKEIEKNKSRVF